MAYKPDTKRISMKNNNGIINFLNDNEFPFNPILLKLIKKTIIEDVIIGEGVFKLGMEVNSMVIIKQKDALVDIIEITTTNITNIILAFKPILTIAQYEAQAYNPINKMYSIFLRIKDIIFS